MYFWAMLDDVFLAMLDVYIHILPSCCFTFQIFKMLSNLKKKKKKRKKIREKQKQKQKEEKQKE